MPILKNHIKRIFLTVLFSLGTMLGAQHAYISFDRITINDGLSLSSVYTIYQDNSGFLWFGTEDGLNKYDGNDFVIYNHQPGEPNSLSHKWIEHIIEDHNGTIWTGSRRGVTAIDPSTEEMRQFLHVNDSLKSLSNDTVTAMIEAGEHIWVGTKKGLNRINVNTQWNKRLYTDSSPACQRINVLAADENNQVWIGTCNGLYRAGSRDNTAEKIIGELPDNTPLKVSSVMIEKDTLWVGHAKGLIKYIFDDDKGRSGFMYPGIMYETAGRVEKIHRDRSNNLWLVSGSGLQLLRNGNANLLVRADYPNPSLAINPSKELFEDEDGYIWFGTFGSGLYRVDPETYGIQHLMHNPANDKSLSDNTINDIYQDRAGSIWIGTFGAGISIYKPHSHIIKTLKHNYFNEQSMSSSFVWSILEDRQGNVWIGTNNSGIDIYNPESGKFSHFTHDPDRAGSLPAGGIRDIFQASNGTFWIASDGGGLCRLNPDGKTFTKFRHDPRDSTTISDNSVRTIYEDSTGTMWIGTRHGLNRLDPRKGVFKRYLHDPGDSTSISHDFIYSAIHMCRRGFLWVGTYGGGLNRLDLSTGTFKSFTFDAADENSISDNIVFSIYEDAKGYMWIGTNSGLNLFNPGNGKFKRYGIASGLPNEVIYGIMPDRFNRLWLTTNRGVSRLDLTRFRFKNYDVRDGLQSNEFNGGAFHAGTSGKIYAGGVYGLSIIDPARMLPEENPAELIITKMEILGEDVSILPKSVSTEENPVRGEVMQLGGKYYLKKHISYLESVKLDYSERFFSIEFAALNHPAPEKLSYRYRMKNMDEGWTNAGGRNYVTYANMRPGSYVLQIDAVNGDGFNAAEIAELKILITPPFWHSAWFIAIEVVLGIALIIFLYRILLNHRTNKILKDQYARIKVANEKLRESENNLRELNATKDKFFSIVSHDLKNPFASVLSISELMHQNFDASEIEEIKHGVGKIHQTNKHIYQLLENLLTWSKSQRGKLSVEISRFNLNKLIETNINIIRLDAERKDIAIRYEPGEEIFASADREMISTVFRNLLNNAIKFTFPGKSVRIATEELEDKVRVSLVDEGIGIEQENLARLFRIEDKFKSNGTAGEKGTGLGLIICKEFIERNDGTLEVTSEHGKGSTFSFTIPLAAVETV